MTDTTGALTTVTVIVCGRRGTLHRPRASVGYPATAATAQTACGRLGVALRISTIQYGPARLCGACWPAHGTLADATGERP